MHSLNVDLQSKLDTRANAYARHHKWILRSLSTKC